MATRLLKWLGIAAAGILLVVVLAAMALPALVNLERYRTLLASRAGKALGREVTLGALRVSLWRGIGAEAQGIQIAQAPGFGAEPLLTADALRVNVRLLPLLRGQVKVSTAVLEQPRIRLARDRDGRWSIDDLLRSKATPAPPRPPGEASRPERAPLLGGLLLSQVAVRGGAFTLTDQTRPGGLTLTLDNLDLSLRQTSPTDPIGLQGRARIGTTGEGWLEANGQIWGADADGVDLDVTLTLRDVDAGPWRAVLLGEGSGIKFAGPLSAEVKAKGPLAKAALAGNLDLKPVTIQVGGAFRKPPGEAATIHFDGLREGQGLNLSRLRIEFRETQVNGSLRIPDLRAPRITFTATAARMDLDRLLVKAPPKGAWLGPGAAHAALPPPEAGSRAGAAGLSAQGRVSIGDLRYQGLTWSAVEAEIRYHGGLVQLSDVRANFMNGRAAARGEMDFRPKIPRIALASRLDNVATEPLIRALALGPWNLRSLLSAESQVSFTGLSAREILGSATGTGSLLFTDGRLTDYRPLDRLSEAIAPILATQGIRLRLNEFEKVSGRYTVDGGVLRTKDLTLTKAEGTVTASGALGLLDSSLNFDVVAKLGRTTVEAKVNGTTSQPIVVPKLGRLQRRLETELEKALPGDKGKGLKDLFKGLFGR
jgi:AsmA protein